GRLVIQHAVRGKVEVAELTQATAPRQLVQVLFTGLRAQEQVGLGKVPRNRLHLRPSTRQWCKRLPGRPPRERVEFSLRAQGLGNWLRADFDTERPWMNNEVQGTSLAPDTHWDARRSAWHPTGPGGGRADRCIQIARNLQPCPGIMQQHITCFDSTTGC